MAEPWWTNSPTTSSVPVERVTAKETPPSEMRNNCGATWTVSLYVAAGSCIA